MITFWSWNYNRKDFYTPKFSALNKQLTKEYD